MEPITDKLLKFENCGTDYLYSGHTGLLLQLDDAIEQALRAPSDIDGELKDYLFGKGAIGETRVAPPAETALQNITVFATNQCNLGCAYCYVSKNNADNEFKMSMDTFERAIGYFLTTFDTSHRINILFFGGEPLLNLPFLTNAAEHLKTIEKNGGAKFSFSLTTNGTVMNDRVLDFLLKYDVSVVISIDSSKDLHDRMRPYKKSGKGSYSRIQQNVKTLSEYKKITARVTLCDLDTDLVNMYDKLRGLGFWNIHTTIVADDEVGSQATEVSMATLKCRIQELEAYFLDNIKRGSLVRFNDYLKYLKRIHVGFNGGNRKKRFPCSAGHSSYCLATSGDFFLCHRFNNVAEMRFGSVEEGIDDAQRKEFLENHQVMSRDGACGSCWASALCGGTCYHPTYADSGNTRPIHDLHCAYTLEIIKSSLRIYLSMPQDSHYLLENIH
jgi:uncharacterized protein